MTSSAPKAILVLSALAAALPAMAQTNTDPNADPFYRGRNESVGERRRPELEPAGVPVGAFRLFPSLSVGLASDDNVFATETNEQSDTIVTLAPEAVLRSQWSRFAVELAAGAERRDFSDLDNESTTATRARADGRVDIRRDLRGRISLSHDGAFERRGDNDPLGLVEPIELTENRVSGGIEKDFNRVRVSVGAARAEADFEDGRLGGGGVVDQDFRDRDFTEWNARVDYALSPTTALFLRYADRTYDYTITTAGPGGNRDFDSNQVLGGVNFDLTELIRGEIGLGRVSSKAAAGGGDVEGLSQYGAIDWFVTGLTTVSFHAGRDVSESGIFGASSVLQEEYRLGVAHELLRNLVLGAEGAWRSDEFEGLDREDDRQVLSVTADWYVNRLAVVHAGVSREEQESVGVSRTRDYDRTSATIGVTLRR